jgi:hypothetical protein
MQRIVLTDGSGRWFEPERAQCWAEAMWWNGKNHVSVPTGMTWRHEKLYRTKSGVWVLHRYARPADCERDVRDHRVNSFKINMLIFDILPYEFVSH